MNAAVGTLLFCIILLGAITCRAEMKPIHLAKSAEVPTPRYYDEQLLNYRMTEFCATATLPPKDFIQTVNNAFEKDPEHVRAAWWWLHDLVSKIQTRCGDA